MKHYSSLSAAVNVELKDHIHYLKDIDTNSFYLDILKVIDNGLHFTHQTRPQQLPFSRTITQLTSR